MNKDIKTPVTKDKVKPKRLKDYLNSNEIFQMMKISTLLDELEFVVENWKDRGNLSIEEHKYLKTSLTWGLKGYSAILKRIDRNSLINLTKRAEKLSIRLEDDFKVRQIDKRNQELINNALEKDIRFYDMVEITMYVNCQGCTKHASECEIAKHFVKNLVAEPYMEQDWEGKHCKYAYKL